MNPSGRRHIRVALVEDDADLRDGTAEFLRELGFPVRTFDRAETLYADLETRAIDVVVLDVGLPGENGFVAAEKLHARSDIAIVMVTAHGSLDDRLLGLKRGADTYLVKPVDLRELAANIDAVARRLPLLPSAAPARSGHWQLSADWTLVSPDSQSLALTSKEYLLFKVLADARGETVPKCVLLERLYGSAAVGCNRLDVLLSRLRKKFERSTIRLPLPIKSVTAIGYVATDTIRLPVPHPPWPR